MIPIIGVIFVVILSFMIVEEAKIRKLSPVPYIVSTIVVYVLITYIAIIWLLNNLFSWTSFIFFLASFILTMVPYIILTSKSFVVEAQEADHSTHLIE